MGTLLTAFVIGVFFTAIAPLCFGTMMVYPLGALGAIIYGLRLRRRYIVALSAILLGNQLVAIPLQHERSHVAALQACGVFAQPQMLRLQVVDLSDSAAVPIRLRVRIAASHCKALQGRQLQFSWYSDFRAEAGQYLLVIADLKPLDYPVNFTGPDRELHIRRGGTAVRGRIRTLVATHPGPVVMSDSNSLRPTVLAKRIGAAIQARRVQLRKDLRATSLTQQGPLLALLTGDSSLMNGAQRELLRATGTSHLLVISGLHVGIVAGLVMALLAIASRLLSFCGLPQLPLFWTGSGIAVLVGYVTFVGAGPSAVRALCMSVVAALWFRHGRLIAPGWGYLAAFVLVALLQPLASLSAGFWLSFALVGWLILAGGLVVQPRSGWPTRVKGLIAMQVGLTAIMAPFLGWLGLPVAPIAVFANLVAVPVVSLLVVPTLLFLLVLELGFAGSGAAIAGLVQTLYWFANALLDGLLTGLTILARGRLPIELHGVGLGMVFVASVVTAIAVLSRTNRAMRLAAVVALASFYSEQLGTRAAQVPWGQVRIEVLDVGQGSAVLVRTQGEALLYDTGARFPTGFSFAQVVIVPVLREQGIEALDLLLLSHSDNDHAGGVDDVVAAVAVRRLATADGCANLGSWVWSGVRFQVLQADLPQGSDNDRSCVLGIFTDDTQVILAGDIEQAAERGLLKTLPQQVDLLLVPHHGSRTSSHRAFVAHLGTRFAIATASMNNPFGHPHPEVRKRYREAGARFMSTGVVGALRWSSRRPGKIRTAVALRSQRWRLGAGITRACDCLVD